MKGLFVWRRKKHQLNFYSRLKAKANNWVRIVNKTLKGLSAASVDRPDSDTIKGIVFIINRYMFYNFFSNFFKRRSKFFAA